MTLYAIAKRSKFGVNATFQSNVEGALRLYRLPVLNKCRQPCGHWVREKAWKVREALTGQSRLRDLTLFFTQILYNKRILIKRVQKWAPQPCAPPQQKVIIGFSWASVVHIASFLLFSSDQRLVSNTSECESLLKPSLLLIATFIHPWLSFVHIFKNWYQ